MNSETKVIGVYHTVKHPDYPKVLNYLKTEIRASEIVAVESPWSLEKILEEGKNTANSSYQFLYNICILLGERGAEIKPVEDQRLYLIAAKLKWWYMFEETDELEKNPGWQKISIKRSIRLLELARKEESDYLVTGILHAYDLQRMGHQKVVLLSDLPENIK